MSRGEGFAFSAWMRNIIRRHDYVLTHGHQCRACRQQWEYMQGEDETMSDDNKCLMKGQHLTALHRDACPVCNPNKKALPLTQASLTNMAAFPEELFDSHRVWTRCGNVTARDVSRVLDALAEMIKERIEKVKA